jgi:hypothetical protein
MTGSVPEALNTLSAGLILMVAFVMVATRQVQGVIRFLVIQSLLLAASCFLLGYSRNSIHLCARRNYRHCQGCRDSLGTPQAAARRFL